MRDDRLTIWADGGVSMRDDPKCVYIAPTLTLTPHDYQQVMHRLDRDLQAFMQVFAAWVSRVAPQLATPLSVQFAHSNNITS